MGIVLRGKVENFNESIHQMTALVQETNEEVFHQQPSVEEWSIAQIASHVIEAVEFWLTDIEALLVVPTGKWGRNHEHVRRLLAVDAKVVSQHTREQTIVGLENLVPQVKATFSKISEEQLQNAAPSYNPNFDGKPLSFMVDHLIVGHVAGHYDQMVRHLAKVEKVKS